MAASPRGSRHGTITRYHPALVALHWLLAILILMELAAGFLVLARTADADPAKAFGLRIHMSVGFTVGVLIGVRLLVRLRTAKPPLADNNRFLQRLAVATHWAFYVAVAGMVVSGLSMALQGGLLPILVGRAVPLPDLMLLAALPVHAMLATSILVLLALHVAGVAYHRLILKENLLPRLWFGPRREDRPSTGSDRAGAGFGVKDT